MSDPSLAAVRPPHWLTAEVLQKLRDRKVWSFGEDLLLPCETICKKHSRSSELHLEQHMLLRACSKRACLSILRSSCLALGDSSLQNCVHKEFHNISISTFNFISNQRNSHLIQRMGEEEEGPCQAACSWHHRRHWTKTQTRSDHPCVINPASKANLAESNRIESWGRKQSIEIYNWVNEYWLRCFAPGLRSLSRRRGIESKLDWIGGRRRRDEDDDDDDDDEIRGAKYNLREREMLVAKEGFQNVKINLKMCKRSIEMYFPLLQRVTDFFFTHFGEVTK